MEAGQKKRSTKAAGKSSKTRKRNSRTIAPSELHTEPSRSDHTGSQEVDNTAELVFLSHQLEMHLTLGTDGGVLNLFGIECERLPWLGNRTSVLGELRDFIESRVPSYSCLQSPDDIRRFYSSRIKQFLEGYDIRIQTKLKITIEENSMGAANVTSPPDWLTVIPYRTRVINNSSELASEEVNVSLPATLISLGPDNIRGINRILLKSMKDFFLERIDLALGKDTIASSSVGTIVRANHGVQVELPVVPLRVYDKVRASGSLKVVLVLPKGRCLEYAFKCSVPNLSRGSVAMFVDLGSSYVKTIRIDIPATSARVSGGFSKLSTLLGRLRPGDIVVKAYGPEPTEKFIEQMHLPQFSKSKIVSEGNAGYIRWLVSCARTMSAEFLSSDRALLSLYVSMPRIAGIDPYEVQVATREATRAFLIDNTSLVSEHAALRERFGRVILELNREAKKEQESIEKTKERNRELDAEKTAADLDYREKKAKYDRHPGIFRWVYRKPKQPDYSFYHPERVPRLDEWRQELLCLKVDPELSEVLILDAGGYSLDAYAKVNGKEYGQSFPAGGLKLTEMLRDYSKQKWGEDPGIERVESKKKELCNTPDPSDSLSKPLSRYTREIYSESLNEVLKWINPSSNCGSKSIPLLLTGGGFNNPHLKDLISEVLDKKKIKVRPYSSIDLANLIEKNKVRSSPLLDRFIQVTYGFEPDKRTQQMSFDICGGMIEHPYSSASWKA